MFLTDVLWHSEISTVHSVLIFINEFTHASVHKDNTDTFHKLDILQFRNPDPLSLEESSPKPESVLYTRRRLHQWNMQLDLRDMFKKASKSVCT